MKVLIEKTNFLPVACVDKNVSNAKKRLSENAETKKLKLHNNVFSSIDKALKSKKARACFIFVAADQHANLVIQSLKNDMHTYCVKPVAINKKEFKNVYSVAKNKKNLQFLQGYNNQWNEAATHMHDIINKDKTIGKILGGQCICCCLLYTSPSPRD